MKENILIVEDDSLIGTGLKLCLEEFGFHVLPVISAGPEAIQSARENKPDLILMDMTLRGSMNGHEIMTVIRRESSVPVIYLTGGDQYEMDDKVKDTKPCDFLIKPFEDEELVRRINKLIDECCDLQH